MPDASEASEFDALLDAAVDAIVVIDDMGSILRFNRAAEVMFGYKVTEVLGRPLAMLMTREDASDHRSYIERYRLTGQQHITGSDREVVARRHDNTTFPAALSVGEAQSLNGHRFVGLIRDLTVQKAAEDEALRHRDQMLHASRLTTMGEMAAAIAHEINQPLSAIATYTAACIRLFDQGPEARDDILGALREIGGQAHRAGEIIQRMRNFTRSRETHRRLHRLGELIEEIRPLAELDARANRVDLRIVIAPWLPLINVDGVQVQQVVLNLLRNGVDAMHEIPEKQRRLTLQAGPIDETTVQVEISDRGLGVQTPDQEGLFTPFFTTKVTGMGMGLAISRSIISAHGGKLDFHNNPEGGVTFHFSLPTAVEA